MEFQYGQFALYVLGALSIPALMWLGVLYTERRSEREAKREGEELMGGPYIGYP
jgi:hypothetical protein